ncbi:MAG: phosphotransferase [Candidatus Paceibacterota bacterium]|jgi:aminoglycoside phosphotransferase (APT) family kinase protein
MKNHLTEIEKIKKYFPLILEEQFSTVSSGTHYDVYASANYVARFRDDEHGLLKREGEFLRGLDHVLIPKVVWMDTVSFPAAMIEKRISGQTIDSVWRSMARRQKEQVVSDVVAFIQYLRTNHSASIYSVRTGKTYSHFMDYLMDGVEQKLIEIQKFEKILHVLEDIRLLLAKGEEIKPLFDISQSSLIHGDLIIHNMLTDNEKLTGVLDWELALYGDPDYDLCRLFYYQECAQAYHEQGVDETYEAEYMNMLVENIEQSDIIKDKKIFQRKYEFVRAMFFVHALYWDAKSEDPESNLSETTDLWNKKQG